jgi:hypothetical protein
VAIAAAEAGVSDVVQANTDDPAELQRLTNNARRRSRRSIVHDDEAVMEESQRRRDDRERRTDDVKAAGSVSNAQAERARMIRRTEEQKANDQMQNTERQRNLRQQQKGEERAAVRSACYSLCFVPFSFGFTSFVCDAGQCCASRRRTATLFDTSRLPLE